MALIACPECNRQVSDKARSCPGCGYCIAKPGSQEAKESQHQEHGKQESLVSLLSESARDIAIGTAADDVKEFFASRAEGLVQVIVATILALISLCFFWPFAIISGIYALRGLYVVFSGDRTKLSR